MKDEDFSDDTVMNILMLVFMVIWMITMLIKLMAMTIYMMSTTITEDLIKGIFIEFEFQGIEGDMSRSLMMRSI